MKYAHLDIDPDVNNIKGLVQPDITMCTSLHCPQSGTCRRSTDSGTKPGMMQSWAHFMPKEKDKACPQYWPVAGARSK